MLVAVNRSTPLLVLPLLTALSLTGCHRSVSTGNDQQQRAQLELTRADLAQIPPPSKNLYMNVRDLNGWENPILTVQQNMITISVLMPDTNPSNVGKGTMLRPISARKNVLNIYPEHLATALNAIPHEAWPYGRVVAIEEAHDAPKQVRPQLRRNMETAMQTLSDLGVVVDEWNDQRPLGLR